LFGNGVSLEKKISLRLAHNAKFPSFYFFWGDSSITKQNIPPKDTQGKKRNKAKRKKNLCMLLPTHIF
jgi:hypothetical protein